MYLENVDCLEKESLLSPALYEELLSIDRRSERERARLACRRRAKKLGIAMDFDGLFKAYQEDVNAEMRGVCNTTRFSGIEHQLKCGEWYATDEGVWMRTQTGREFACRHPIYPEGEMVNIESGEHKLLLAFKERRTWKHITLDRSLLATRSSITALSKYGVAVTSENANMLVRYLSDVLSLNEELIPQEWSASRFGWVGTDFIPYGEQTQFDDIQALKGLFNSVATVGSRDAWYRVARDVRQAGRKEVLVYMAASLASAIIEPCDALPFIVNLWGGTGLGKTVALMLATSIWADPKEGTYITDAKATVTAMEIRMNALHSLPMALDDMAQVKNHYNEDFSELIYRWCAGRGRDRSNINLGLNRLTNWANCTLTNAERALTTESTQGGAVNRVIDVEIGERPLFEDGNAVVKTISANYGFAGREFVEAIQHIGFEAIEDIVEKYRVIIKATADASGHEKPEKQIIPMALILAADEIAERELYKDGVRLNLDECIDLLKDVDAVSEHERALEYLKGIVIANKNHFDTSSEQEIWGKIDRKHPGHVSIIRSTFDNILTRGGFQSTAFLSWADRRDMLAKDGKGHLTKVVRFGDWATRCVCIKLFSEAEAFQDTKEMNESAPF